MPQKKYKLRRVKGSSKMRDRMRKAKKPGKRRAPGGGTYFETRENRADVNPMKML